MIKIVGYIGLHVKYTLFLSDFNDFELSPQIFGKILKYELSSSFFSHNGLFAMRILKICL